MMLRQLDLGKDIEDQQSLKSILHFRKQAFYKRKSHLLKQKKFRELRFEALLKDIQNPDNIEKYNKIQSFSVVQLRNRIQELMQTKNILGLAITIQKLQQPQKKVVQVFDQSLIQDFIKFSSNLLFHAQIAIIYKALLFFHSDVCQSILKRPQIANQIMKQIFRLKDSNHKTIYIQILKRAILRDVQTHKQQLILDYFQRFYTLTKKQIISQYTGVNILMLLSRQIFLQINISNQVIQYISQIYENCIKNYQRNLNTRKTIYNCQNILSALFLNRSNGDIKFYFKSFKLLVSLRKQLIQLDSYFKNYKDYFYFLIVGIVLKIKQTQRMLMTQQRSQLKKILKKQNPLISEQRLKKTIYPLTTMICDYILRKNRFILSQKSYNTQHVLFLNILIEVMDQKSVGQYFQRQNFMKSVIEDSFKRLRITSNTDSNNTDSNANTNSNTDSNSHSEVNVNFDNVSVSSDIDSDFDDDISIIIGQNIHPNANANANQNPQDYNANFNCNTNATNDDKDANDKNINLNKEQ